MGKKPKAKKAKVSSQVSLGRDNVIQVDDRWNMVYAGLQVSDTDGSMSIAGHKFDVSRLNLMSGLSDYRPNVDEFIRQVRLAKMRLKASLIHVLVNMIWTVDGQPHLVSAMIARDVRIQEKVSGLVLFIQRQQAVGRPGSVILSIRPECFTELAAYFGMDRTPEAVGVAGMYMLAWAIPDEVADQLREAYIPHGNQQLYFNEQGFPVGSTFSEIVSKPRIAKAETPVGREFAKLSRAAKQKLLERKLKASRATK